jgi:putative FmdB family regulatory protein
MSDTIRSVVPGKSVPKRSKPGTQSGSKLMMFDFRCKSCNHEFEDLVKSDVFQAQCPKCSETARRILSCPRIDKTAMALQDGATETSLKHFERTHQQQKAKEEKSLREHGDYGKSPGSD